MMKEKKFNLENKNASNTNPLYKYYLKISGEKKISRT